MVQLMLKALVQKHNQHGTGRANWA